VFVASQTAGFGISGGEGFFNFTGSCRRPTIRQALSVHLDRFGPLRKIRIGVGAQNPGEAIKGVGKIRLYQEGVGVLTHGLTRPFQMGERHGEFVVRFGIGQITAHSFGKQFRRLRPLLLLIQGKGQIQARLRVCRIQPPGLTKLDRAFRELAFLDQ